MGNVLNKGEQSLQKIKPVADEYGLQSLVSAMYDKGLDRSQICALVETLKLLKKTQLMGLVKLFKTK